MIMYINMFKYMNCDSHHWRMPLVLPSAQVKTYRPMDSRKDTPLTEMRVRI